MPIRILIAVLGLLLQALSIGRADALSLASTQGAADSGLADFESRAIYTALESVNVDRRIRVLLTRSGTTLQGRFTSLDTRFLTMSAFGARDDPTTRIALVEIDSLWSRHDGGDLGGDIGSGVLGTAGAAAGVAVGGFSGGSATALGYSFLGAVAGFVVGRVIGSAIGANYGEWRREYP